MTNAIILSAGQGRRLLPLTENSPKCLLKVRSRSLIEWQITTLLAAGIDTISVVAGYKVDRVRQHLQASFPEAHNISIIFNPFYEVSDNLASCWMARSAMHDNFLLINGDTLFSRPLLETVLAATEASITLTTDTKANYDDDDMKVALQGKHVQAVSKLLPARQTDAESIGMLYFRGTGVTLFRDRLEAEIKTAKGVKAWFLSVIDSLAKEGHVQACSIAGAKWCEIDFLEDLEAAQSVFTDKSD